MGGCPASWHVSGTALRHSDVVNLGERDPGLSGRHAFDTRQSRVAPRPEFRLYVALFVVAVGIATALVRWAVSTWLLGANLATPVHVIIVTLFLLVVAVAAYLSLWQGCRRLARWSRERGARRVR